MLIKSISSFDINVKKIDRRRRFIPFAIQNFQTSVLHLHWLHSYYWPPFSLKSRYLKYLVLPVSVIRLLVFIIGLAIYRLLGGKIVWTAHNIKYHEQVYPFLDYFCTFFVAKFSHAIIAHGKTAKAKIISTFNLKDTHKISVIPHGNYIEVYKNNIEKSDARNDLGLLETDIVFLFFGFIRPYKGVFELIEAFQSLNIPDIKLVIAGKPLNDSLATKINNLTSKDSNILFIPGFVDDNRIQIFMNASDAVILPYRDILTSGAAVLAMSFGKACVAVKLGSICDVLDDSGAYLYNPDSETALLNAIEVAAKNHTKLAAMGDHNMQQSESWSWSYVANSTYDVYKSCFPS